MDKIIERLLSIDFNNVESVLRYLYFKTIFDKILEIIIIAIIMILIYKVFKDFIL